MNQRLATLVALPLLIALTVTGCATTAAPASSSTDTGSDAAPAEGEEAPAEEAPAADTGTRENPTPAGTVIELSSMSGEAIYQVTIGAVTVNANDAVATENEFNEPAPEGFQYLMFPVTYTYVGSETGTPWIDVSLEYVSAAGTTHSSSDTFASVANPILDINELYPDASGSGSMVLLVPSADVDSGLLTVGTLFGGDKVFVKLA